jgi:hypothetical protein
MARAEELSQRTGRRSGGYPGSYFQDEPGESDRHPDLGPSRRREVSCYKRGSPVLCKAPGPPLTTIAERQRDHG